MASEGVEILFERDEDAYDEDAYDNDGVAEEPLGKLIEEEVEMKAEEAEDDTAEGAESAG